MAILLSLLAIALLALTVYLLHSYQQQQKIDSVDRTVPLPPLETGISLAGEDLSEDIPGGPTEAVADDKPSVAATDSLSPLPPTSSALPLSPSPSTPIPAPSDWLTQSRTLKDESRFDEALAIAMSAYPQIGAFRQACVILRAQLREQRRNGIDQEATLVALYRTCALAAFFHAPDDEIPPLPLSAQRRLHDRSWLLLPMPYDQLGTLHLDLLTTTDVKMLTAAWGKPPRHERVRQYHESAWNTLQTLPALQ